ncbi:hypothetical protein L7F22_064607 [Adiantum nelumboides]|nr:hypothetical protein [Adiantum nelumboides]
MEEALNAALDAVYDERRLFDGEYDPKGYPECYEQEMKRQRVPEVQMIAEFEQLVCDDIKDQIQHAVISSQSDIDEETDFSELGHAMHASIAANNDQETCLSKPICDVDVHVECALDGDHEEIAYVALDEDTGDDVDVFDADPYVFYVNSDKDYNYGDAYSEGVLDDKQTMIATGDKGCYDDAMEKEIDTIFAMHAESCATEVERYLNGSVKLPEQLVPMYETCDEVSCDDTHKLGGSSKEEDMELMHVLDDALEEFRVPCETGSKEHLATYDLILREHALNEELMMLLDGALEEFVPTKEASYAAFLVMQRSWFCYDESMGLLAAMLQESLWRCGELPSERLEDRSIDLVPGSSPPYRPPYREEGGSNLAPSLQEQIDHTIQHLNPRRLLELLSLPLEREHEGRRQEGKLGIQAILWTIGDGGAFLPIPGFTRESYLKEAFSHLTAAEQVGFFSATPSNIPAESSEVYAVALAHIAEGFVSKKPHMIQEADTLFLELQQVNASPSDLSIDFRPADQKLEFTFERGMCALLLGEIDDCRAWLGLDDTSSPYRDQLVADFVAANTSEGEELDFLPGLCKLLESWLGVAVIPNFRGLREFQVHLRDYFDDPNVLSYLEKLEKGGSPLAAAAAIVQLGAGAGAALDSVKASALETLQKVFHLKKGKSGPVMDYSAYDTLSVPSSSEQMLTKGLEDEVQMDTAPERGSSVKPASPFERIKPSEVSWSPSDKFQGAELQKLSPFQIAGASVLMGVLVLGGWRVFSTGKGLLKPQTNYSEELMENSQGSAVSSLAQKPLPQIDARIAEKIVRRWQAVKSQALGRDHAVKGLAEVLDGQMLENMSGRAQDAQKNGWYWDYKLTNLNIDSVTISTDGRRATVEATLWEGANLYDEKTAQVLDSYQSSYTIRYELATINGRWKITSGIVLKS